MTSYFKDVDVSVPLITDGGTEAVASTLTTGCLAQTAGQFLPPVGYSYFPIGGPDGIFPVPFYVRILGFSDSGCSGHVRSFHWYKGIKNGENGESTGKDVKVLTDGSFTYLYLGN